MRIAEHQRHIAQACHTHEWHQATCPGKAVGRWGKAKMSEVES